MSHMMYFISCLTPALPRDSVFDMLDEENSPESRDMLSTSRFSAEVVNIGSTCRDYCALERTFLSYIRLGLVLISLSGSILCDLRFPRPGSPSHLPSPEALTLGILYGIGSLSTIALGLMWYENGVRGLHKQKAFIDGDLLIHDVIMGGVAVLILATALILLMNNRSA